MSGVLIQIELAGKINNLPSFKSEALLPVFEAVVDSIQAIEDASPAKGRVVVSIRRDSQKSLSKEMDRQKPITAFGIDDNGIGFDQTNHDAFRTADATHKFQRGCKGIARVANRDHFQIHQAGPRSG